MKILVVSQYFWPEEFRINDLVAGLTERGHQVTVVTGLPNYPGGRLFAGYSVFGPLRQRYGGAEVVRIPLIPRGSSLAHLAVNYISFAVAATLLAPLRCSGDYDAIFVFEPSPVTVAIPALALKWRSGAPLLFWVQDMWPHSLSATGAVRNRTLLAAVDVLVRWIYRGCDLVLAQSRAFIPLLRKQRVAAEKIVYFPNSVEEHYHPVAQVPDDVKALLPTGFVVMFAGNIGVAQDFATVLAAAQRLRDQRDIHWVIVGDGSRRDWLRQQVQQRGLEEQVHLPGRYPVERMSDFFAAAQVLLVTLKKDPVLAATIPSKVQSYMACGKAVVAALDGEGARIVAESGCGFASAAEDAGALAENVLRARNLPPQELALMGRRGRDYCRANFDRQAQLDHLEQLLRKVATQRGGSSGRKS